MSVCAIARPPVVLEEVVALTPVTVSDIRVAAPITINATLGQAGLWTGEGPPTTVVGAVIGDEYLDVLSGTIYRLDPGV